MYAKLSMTITLDDKDYEVVVEGDFDPGDPGQTSGPPERCWEPYPGDFEIAVLSWPSGEPHRALNDVEMELLEAACFEWTAENLRSEREAVAEAHWERLSDDYFDSITDIGKD